MDGINRNIHILIQSVKKSSVYKEYRLQEGILNQNPELAERVRQFRADNFRLQNEEDREYVPSCRSAFQRIRRASPIDR